MRKRKIKSVAIRLSVFLILALASLLYLHMVPDAFREAFVPVPGEAGTLEVHVIDVGQGDSILVKSPEKNLLIDAGDNDKGEQVLRYLKDNGVDRIDYLIATHPHADHIGGMDYIIKNMPVSVFIMSELTEDIVPTNKTFTDLMDALEDKGLQITLACAGDKYGMGEDSELTLLGPRKTYDNLNDVSVVASVTYKNKTFLFTGDSESAENDIPSQELKADFLKVAHHGSKTSSSGKFLQAVNPEIAVISAGLNNRYNLPSGTVVKRIEDMGIKLFRTDINGSVVIKTDGYEMK